MTPSDIRKLIGGYATGTLTEAERQLLFEAALEDQELFEELAREQALKEMLDEPGARDRLISALKPPQPKRIASWPWAAAAAVFATGVVMMVILYRPAAPRQIAAVTQRSEPAAPPAVPKAVPAPAPPAPKRVAPKAATPSASEPAPAPPPPAAAEPQAIGQLTAPSGAAPSGSAQGASAQAAPRQAFARAAIAPAAANASRFAFDYTLEPGGPLQIKTTGDGYLSVIARDAGSGHVMFPTDGDGRVSNGSVTNIDIPQDATEMSIFFSARSGSAVAEDSAAKAKEEAAIRDSTSGTLEDPAPSPNSRLSITVRVKK